MKTILLFICSVFLTSTAVGQVNYLNSNRAFKNAIAQQGVVVVELWISSNDHNSYDIDRLKNCYAYRVNVEEFPELIDVYDVYHLPSVLFFKDSEFKFKREANITWKSEVTLEDLQAHVNQLLREVNE